MGNEKGKPNKRNVNNAYGGVSDASFYDVNPLYEQGDIGAVRAVMEVGNHGESMIRNLVEQQNGFMASTGYLNEIFSSIEQSQKCIDDVLHPTRAFQAQIDGLLEPHRKFKESSQELFTALSHNHLADHIDSVIRPEFGSSLFVDEWKKLTDIQSSFNLPENYIEAIKGFDIDTDMFSGIAADFELDRLNDISQMLSLDSVLLGEFDVDFDDKQEGEAEDDESVILLPENYQNQLKAVNYLPVELYKKILNDPALMRHIDPREFEYLIAELIENLGFENVVVTPQSGDGGRDIFATTQFNGINMMYSFECKRYKETNKIGPGTMRSLLGSVTQSKTQANIGVLVTTSSFTSGSKKLIASEAALDGKDFNDLVAWVNRVKE